jgi:hypothetical protein
MPELMVESGPYAGRAFAVEGPVVIGRGEHVAVRIDDVTISREHAGIRPGADGEWEIVDLGSANGTLLNDGRLSASAHLREGDRVQLGQVTFRFGPSGGAALAAATPLPAEGPGARVFQDLLSRQKLFCQLGALAGSRLDVAARALEVLDAVLQAHPHVDRAVLYGVVAGDPGLAVQAARRRDRGSFDAMSLAGVAHEGLSHAAGLLFTTDAERDAVAARIAVAPPSGVVAVLPMRRNGETVGVLYLDSLDDTDALRRADREHLLGVAGIAACLLALG